ncbi:MAG: hypothetical protein AB1894_28060 [Chloroflexota bacterium]
MTVETSYLCPQCGRDGLEYDGALLWRSGTRPPRQWARKDLDFLQTLGRADYERECLYHCQQCGAEFFEDVDSSCIHLYAESGHFVRYVYNVAHETWQYEVRRQPGGRRSLMSFDRARAAWVELPMYPTWAYEVYTLAFITRRPPLWRLYAQSKPGSPLD